MKLPPTPPRRTKEPAKVERADPAATGDDGALPTGELPSPPPLTRGGAFARAAAPTGGHKPELDALLSKFGLERSSDAEPPAKVRRSWAARIGGNLRAFVDGLKQREAKVVGRTVEVLRAMGLAALKTTTFNDLRQLQDFIKLGLEHGRPFEFFAPLKDVAWFVWKYPEEARKILAFLDGAERDTWKQKSAWQPPQVRAVEQAKRLPQKSADVVVIGAGLTAGAIARGFADAFKAGERPRQVLVIERDGKDAREHMASLRNAGIICTALDYVFDVDEAVGDRPIERIAEALKIPRAEAEQAYASLTAVMRDATARVRAFLKQHNVDLELKTGGTIDIAQSASDLEAFQAAAAVAQEYGLDWHAVDQEFLKQHHGIDSDHVVGGLHMRDSAQLHPGKLVKALFDHARQTSEHVKVQYDTSMLGAEKNKDGTWTVLTSQGPIKARHVVDAREAFALYPWREARYSQIHLVKVDPQAKPNELGEANVCHSLTYMRRVDDTHFLVGSGDFPIDDPTKPPKPIASVALYAAAHFKKLFPDVPYDIEKVWGGVFGRSPDDLPVAGELLDGWFVVGGAGGSGLNITPAMAEQAVAHILGDHTAKPFQPEADFSPRRFFLLELREALAATLRRAPMIGVGVTPEKVRIVVEETVGPTPLRLPRVHGDELHFVVDERTLDEMNTDASKIFAGERGEAELRSREAAKARWLARQLMLFSSGKVEHGPAPRFNVGNARATV